jgi:hypothetical protein
MYPIWGVFPSARDPVQTYGYISQKRPYHLLFTVSNLNPVGLHSVNALSMHLAAYGIFCGQCHVFYRLDSGSDKEFRLGVLNDFPERKLDGLSFPGG